MIKINIGISSCLLGENVLYDGGHKLDGCLKDTLDAYVDYVPVGHEKVITSRLKNMLDNHLFAVLSFCPTE